MFEANLLRGKRILVTGGGSGLGREIAERYLQLGAEVHICGRRQSIIDTAAAELTARHGGLVRSHAVDIREADSVDAMIERIWAEHGPLDGLVNNAAGNFVSRTQDVSPRGFDAVANTVLHGTYYVTHHVGRRWIAGGHRGSIVSIVVTWVRTGAPFVVPSAMSKAGVEVMTRSLAIEWGRYGIRLNAIAPGIFPTEGANSRLSPKAAWEDGVVRNPMNRLGRMSELQNLAVFLMADGVEWINGETIAIDGAGHRQNGASFTELAELDDNAWREMREAIRSQDQRDRSLRAAPDAAPFSGTDW
ncbi:putative 2,4-dienoyl-CoA reductase [Variovorax sp. PBL-H6]|uniref:SDR family oxidoreductase n=1 Tax=Variovorax sp. PBL-H6 TaxID=434009 RepID=UPI001317364B|nr:SDR family oxidoreductase [Variovorax sp. PBL-H6]VTU21512.1 putative 2,4-dienoyl-CoA reductase [Variovorax sp. PBL-H6]